MKKKIIIGIIILTLFVIGSIHLYNYLRVKFAKIEVILKDDLTLEFNDKKKVSDYIENINGKIIDDYIIDSKELGKKDVIVSFINEDKIKVKYTYQVDVVDRVEPLIWLGDTYSVKVGSNIDLTNKILCGDNYDSNVKCWTEGYYDLNTVGNYDLTYKAMDNSGNKEQKDFTLKVVEPTKNTKKNTNHNQFSDVVKEYKNENNQIGIDVSAYQGDIDFEKIKQAGVEFIMIRVGYTKGQNGEYILDKKFIQNIEGANKYGIKAGVYFYSYAGSIKEVKKDAEWVYKQIKDYKIDLPVVFDWEEWTNFNEYNLSFFDLNNIAEGFLKEIEKHGYKGMLYSSKNYLENIWFDMPYDVWIAQYYSEVTYNGTYKMWQICDNGLVDGIDTDVDINILY